MASPEAPELTASTTGARSRVPRTRQSPAMRRACAMLTEVEATHVPARHDQLSQQCIAPANGTHSPRQPGMGNEHPRLDTKPRL